MLETFKRWTRNRPVETGRSDLYTQILFALSYGC
jgi:hypothetical protein